MNKMGRVKREFNFFLNNIFFTLSFSLDTWLPFGLFGNSLPEIKRFGDLPCFLALFVMLRKIVYFKACFGEIWVKLPIFYEMLALNLAILTIFFEENLAFDWPFSYLRIWSFSFFWTWQHWLDIRPLFRSSSVI